MNALEPRSPLSALTPATASPASGSSDTAPCPAPSCAAVSAAAPASQVSRAESLAVWFAGSALAVLVIAWLAFQVQAGGVAPELLFPIGVGLLLGVALRAVQRKSRLTAGRWLIAAAVCWGLLAALGQEYCGYCYYCRQFVAMQNSPRLGALARAAVGQLEPARFVEFLQASIRRRDAAWWTLDGLATVLTAAIVVGCSLARPAAAEDKT